MPDNCDLNRIIETYAGVQAVTRLVDGEHDRPKGKGKNSKWTAHPWRSKTSDSI
jgi:hypothetical protein